MEKRNLSLSKEVSKAGGFKHYNIAGQLVTVKKLSNGTFEIVDESGKVIKRLDNFPSVANELGIKIGKGKSGGAGIGKVEIKYPLSSTNKKHINKHNIESIKQQSIYLSDSQLAEKLESSFFNPKWSKDDINKYAEIA
ncbi:hypothetical protein [Paenibacillus thiaminolyticus]|uniref:hypothetical protein n=1 Tax=Paenibacillus thiaminolyticus TaxID=49283 RepID=UPI002543C5B4|nr:hypothetical protein [Paenibacillus thiaminolyticus]WII39025.1 hypothetical protein O0V01_08015 [Paenibacillus thiaminolyticus]